MEILHVRNNGHDILDITNGFLKKFWVTMTISIKAKLNQSNKHTNDIDKYRVIKHIILQKMISKCEQKLDVNTIVTRLKTDYI